MLSLIHIQDLTGDSGVYVAEVTSGSSAEKAKMAAGDIIIKLGDTEITSMNDLNKALYNYKTGDKAEITVLRNGREQKLTVTFSKQFIKNILDIKNYLKMKITN